MEETPRPPAIRIGIIGAGGIVRQRHLPGLLGTPGVEIAVICNARRSSAEAVVADFNLSGTEIAEEWTDLLGRDDLDAIVVGAPPLLHAAASCAALRTGRHVFCQARMAMDAAEAAQMWEASISNPELVAALCPAPHGLRLGKAVRALLEGGSLGAPIHLRLNSYHASYLDPAAPAHWRQRAEVSGLNTLTLGIYAEVLQRWFGRICSVKASGGIAHRRRDGYEVEIPDFLDVLCDFESGVSGSLSFSGVAAHAPGDRLEVYCERGALAYDFAEERLFAAGSGEAALQEIVPPPDEITEWTAEADFIRAIRDPQAPRPTPDFAEGLRYMRVTEAVHQALESGDPINVW